MVTEENHQEFIDRFEKSKGGVQIAAEWLKSRGNSVKIPKSTVAPTHRSWRKYADNGDLIVRTKKNKKYRCEVKQLSISFTCREDWPYKDFFMVCSKHSWDFAKEKPRLYIIMNKQGTHAGIVKAKTFPTWYVQSRHDGRRVGSDAYQYFYFCPMKHIRFMSLETP